MKFILLAAGLLILIVVNIVLGSVGAFFEQKFDWVKMWKGAAKGGVVLLCFMAVYLAGYLNPDIVVIEINGQVLTLVNALYILVMSGFLYYAAQVITKLAQFVKGKINITEKEIPTATDSSGK